MIASANGLQYEGDLETCTFDGHVAICWDLLKKAINTSQYKSAISLYNPNLKVQRGFFLKVPAEMSRAIVKTKGEKQVI